MPDIEYFYSAHSAFAYIGSTRLMEIAKTNNCRIVHKPVHLNKVMAEQGSSGFNKRSDAHINYYFVREIERWAEMRDVQFKGDIPPNHRNDMTLANCMLIACSELGGDVDRLAHLLLQGHWRDHADLADEAVLSQFAEQAGQDVNPLLDGARSAEVLTIYETNTAEAVARSVFGSPTYFVDDDMFYGQDHLEFVERAITRPFANKWTPFP